MNKRQKQVVAHQIRQENAVLRELEEQYEETLKSIDQQILEYQSMDDTPSKAYRIEYQKRMKQQLEANLELLHSKQYQTVDQYLNDTYTNGFVGTMYDLHGQDVPVIAPIDQKAVLRAVTLDTKLKEPLYKAIGVDVQKLKKSISSEITRALGISVTTAPLGRIKTIVRTEGHRIQEASTDDARKEAIKRGADLVKQWDATLDGKTRETHRMLDGQVREEEEYFEVGTKKAMYPGEFGLAEEDCNCRCLALSRARSALDEYELEEMKKRAEFFGLDKSESFREFEKKYLKAAKNVENSDNLRYNAGGVSGAYNDKNDPGSKKRDAHAKRYYEALRNNSKEYFVKAVSRNASIDEDTVSKVYKHVFEDKHNLDKGYTYFEPDYYMAESFRRLRTNDNIQEHDIILLKHEAMEYDIMQKNPDMSYDEAHEITAKKYNYKKALIEWLKKEGD